MLVSAVMPTANRRHMVPGAIDCFLSQTWAQKELLVLDDGEDPVYDLIPPDSSIKYVGPGDCRSKKNIPTKRNIVNGLATGRVIMHWDDDDWSAPERMESQVEHLIRTGKDLVGFHSMHFWDVESTQAYHYSSQQNVWACGTSFCYWTHFWGSNPYKEDIDLSTDNIFCRAARISNGLATVPGGTLMVARVHAGTTNPKNLESANNFKRIETGSLNDLFPLD